MTTASIPELEQAIERLVQEHLAAYETKVRATLRGAVSRVSSSSRQKLKATNATKTKMAPRRTPEELAAVCEKFYDAVEKHPGETMRVLVEGLKLSPRVLETPVLKLKKAGRVRTVGEGPRTRYFPMAAPSTT